MKRNETYVLVCLKLNFFHKCKESNIIPRGLVIEKNLATHINDEEFVKDVQDSLNEASSRSFDKIIEKFEYTKLKLFEELEDSAEDLGLGSAERVQIERGARESKARQKLNLNNKHLRQVQQVHEFVNAPFALSRGSRKVRGVQYIPPKYCNCNKKRIRPHRLKRKKKRKKDARYYGPRRETLKDIIEVEQAKRDPINLTDFVLTDSMKEVLRLGATFAPTPTQPIDTYSLYIDFQK